jgi:hypothetical protein
LIQHKGCMAPLLQVKLPVGELPVWFQQGSTMVEYNCTSNDDCKFRLIQKANR